MVVLVDHAHGGRRNIRLLTGQHLVEDDAQTIYVTTLVHLIPMSLFRAHVVGRAKNLACSGQINSCHALFGKTKIDQGDTVVTPQHHVTRLDVAVKHADPMDGGQRSRHLLQVSQGVRFRDAFPDALAQVTIGEILHRDVGMIVTDTEVANPYDIRVMDRRYEFVLLQEPLECALPFRDVGYLPQNLDDNGFARFRILHQVNRGDAAFGQSPHEPVALERVFTVGC